MTDWQSVPAQSAGFSEQLPERLTASFRNGVLQGLHAVAVLRDGKLVLEQYFEGEDERWGESLGRVRFDAGTVHDLRSVSKSIVGLLYGIALASGDVPALDALLVSQFEHLDDLARDPRRRALKVRHALGMSLGIEWNEDLPYDDPRNGEIAMEHSADRIRFVLERPIIHPPGQRWCYCGGATAWLAASLEPRLRVDDEVDYGLHWWIGRLRGSGNPWWSANGNGGQRLFIAPSLGIVIVVLCGNYNRPRHWRVPITVISNHALGALQRTASCRNS